MIRDRLAGLTFAAAFIGLIYLMISMFASFTPSIVFGLVLTGLFWPMRTWLVEEKRVGKYTAAALVCAAIVAAVILPTLFFAVRLSQEALNLYENTREYLTADGVTQLLFGKGLIADSLRKLCKAVGIDYNLATLQELVVERGRQASFTLFENLNVAAGNVFNFFIQFVSMLVLIFGLMVDGPALMVFLLNLSPLPNDDELLIIEKFNQMSYVTLVGNGLGGLIQGGLAGLGFWMAGIDSTILWTAIMVVLAFIPLVGMSVVFVPACLVLWIEGEAGTAVTLLIYCTVVATLVENWFKPWFMAGRVEINSIVVFFAILGGLAEFGVAGIFYGPLIFTIFLTFVQLYHARFVPRETPIDGEDPPSPSPTPEG